MQYSGELYSSTVRTAPFGMAQLQITELAACHDSIISNTCSKPQVTEAEWKFVPSPRVTLHFTCTLLHAELAVRKRFRSHRLVNHVVRCEFPITARSLNSCWRHVHSLEC